MPSQINSDNIYKVLTVILAVSVFLSGIFFYVRLKSIESQVSLLNSSIQTDIFQNSETQLSNSPLPSPAFSDTCGKVCKSEIEKAVNEALATVSGTTVKTVVQKQAVSNNQTVYIPLAGPVSSTSTGWVDVPGTDVYIDLIKDYGTNAKVSWEASLKIAHANGTAYARLFDSTHGIAVTGSELNVVGKDTLTSVSSGYLGFWAGRNLYKVQIKSLNSFEATFASGRIKVSY